MITYPFREHHPVRTCSKVFTDYTRYKKYLVVDFKNRCGYTDCPDWWFGGKSHFHIDHFLPHSNPKHLHLKHTYSNLVYACSFVNGADAKSNKEGDFLDPCDTDYNLHFERNEFGEIIPNSKSALFMQKELKLYLKRYSLIWLLDKLEMKISLLGEKLRDLPERYNRLEILELRNELFDEYENYKTYLRKEDR